MRCGPSKTTKQLRKEMQRKVKVCPHCDSYRVIRTHILGQYSYLCDDCKRWGPWKEIKRIPARDFHTE